MRLTKGMTLVVEGKYRLDMKIGEGSFGKIFSGINKNTKEEVAVKIESSTTSSPLRNEARIYSALRDMEGIPKLRAWGKEGHFNYLVLDLLGLSLEDSLEISGGVMELNVAMMVGIQMVERIKNMHEHGIIHRDVKPANFVFGKHTDRVNYLYIIDFGLAKSFGDNKHHMKKTEGRSLIGTARFVSINVHDGIAPSRRDDIESVGYVLVYLLLGKLPWQGIECDNEQEKQQKIGDIKRTICLREIYGIPEGLIRFLEHCRKLRFDEQPNYAYLNNLLLKCNIT